MRKILSFILLAVIAPPLWGVVGASYFQQHVSYKISVTLNDKLHELHGNESIEYTNNSPDTLTFIWFHLWPNAYRDKKTALAKQLIADGNKDFYFATPDQLGYMDHLAFKEKGQPAKLELHPEHIDIVKVVLNEPLLPGRTTSISTTFHVKIPIGVFSRLGHIHQQYQITQWYPKPAVYDRYGWHEMPYLNQGEFYSEFGSFDVSIELPKNYVVGATGALVNGEEEIAWLKEKSEITRAIQKFNPVDTITPSSSSEMKVLRFRADSIHDFAWFADKRYHVLHEEVELPYSKRKVDCWAMFTSMEGDLWSQGAKYVRDAVYYYSLWNGDYPYPHATAVDGALSAGGGMEYPMITVIGKSGNAESLDRVIAHEVGHNWFYGILGSNERDHAWMDEGVNSFNEQRYMEKKYPKDSTKSGMAISLGGLQVNIGKLLGIPDMSEESLFDLGYRFNAVRKLDQPCDLHSAEYTSINYGTVVYGKTATLLRYLQAYLGEELYDKCAKAYFEKWKFKHPYPEDMKKVYEEVSGKNLDWLFKGIIPTTDDVDYKACKFSTKAIHTLPRVEKKVIVRNNGKVKSPLSISLIKDGKIISTEWHEGFVGKKSFDLPASDFDQIKIDAKGEVPDFNRHNNTLKTKGLCKKTEPFNLRMFGVIKDPNKTQLFWAPVLTWNKYNSLMPGLAIYSNVLPEKKFEYVFVPMYSIHTKNIVGAASLNYNIHPGAVFQTIRLGVNARRTCTWNDTTYWGPPEVHFNMNKVSPYVELEIKKKRLKSKVKQTILLRQVNLLEEIGRSSLVFLNADGLPYSRGDEMTFHEFNYVLDHTRPINPFSIQAQARQWNDGGDNYLKTSLTGNYKFTLKGKGKSVDVRLYWSKIFEDDNYPSGDYPLHVSGGRGEEDYLFDYSFPGRSEYQGFLSKQFTETEGALKAYTPLGRTGNWVTSMNIKASLPGKIPFRLFADVAAYKESSLFSYMSTTKIYYLHDLGIYIPLVKNVIEIYCPIVVSSEIRRVFYLNNTDLKPWTPERTDPDKWKRMARMIRFTFNIQRLNPFSLVRNISL